MKTALRPRRKRSSGPRDPQVSVVMECLLIHRYRFQATTSESLATYSHSKSSVAYSFPHRYHLRTYRSPDCLGQWESHHDHAGLHAMRCRRSNRWHVPNHARQQLQLYVRSRVSSSTHTQTPLNPDLLSLNLPFRLPAGPSATIRLEPWEKGQGVKSNSTFPTILVSSTNDNAEADEQDLGSSSTTSSPTSAFLCTVS